MSVVLPTAPTSHAAVSQMRALWVDAFNSGIKTPQQIEQLVADARRGGFNALIVQVRRRGDAFYLSGIEPRSQDPALAPAPFDPLATLISTAQAQGIELHAWIAVLPIWRESLGQPSDPSHVYWQHGPHVAGSDNWVALGVNGESSVDGDTWLDPGHPAVVNYTAAVVRDLLERYPNVNILLDHIGFPRPELGPNFGLSPQHRALTQHKNVYYKYTTLLIEQLHAADVSLKPFLEHMVETFGADQMTWGSDVGNTPGSMFMWVQYALDSASGLTEQQQRDLFYNTAAKIHVPGGRGPARA